jgi:hypothetical protein
MESENIPGKNEEITKNIEQNTNIDKKFNKKLQDEIIKATKNSKNVKNATIFKSKNIIKSSSSSKSKGNTFFIIIIYI